MEKFSELWSREVKKISMLLAVLGAVSLISACGNYGELYLPARPNSEPLKTDEAQNNQLVTANEQPVQQPEAQDQF